MNAISYLSRLLTMTTIILGIMIGNALAGGGGGGIGTRMTIYRHRTEEQATIAGLKILAVVIVIAAIIFIARKIAKKHKS